MAKHKRGPRKIRGRPLPRPLGGGDGNVPPLPDYLRGVEEGSDAWYRGHARWGRESVDAEIAAAEANGISREEYLNGKRSIYNYGEPGYSVPEGGFGTEAEERSWLAARVEAGFGPNDEPIPIAHAAFEGENAIELVDADGNPKPVGPDDEVFLRAAAPTGEADMVDAMFEVRPKTLSREAPAYPSGPRQQRGRPRKTAKVYNPLVALERQLEMVRLAQNEPGTPRGLTVTSMLAGTEFSSKYFLNQTDNQNVLEAIRHMRDVSFAPLIAAATPVFFSSEMLDVVLEAMPDLPDTVTIQPHDLKAGCQFIWLEKPVRLAGKPNCAGFSDWAHGFLVVDVPPDLQALWRSRHDSNDAMHIPDISPAKSPRVLVYTLGFTVGQDENGNDWSISDGKGFTLTDWDYLDVLDWQNWLKQDTVAVNYSYERGRQHFVNREDTADNYNADGVQMTSYAYIDHKVQEAIVKVPVAEYLDYADRAAYDARQLAAAVIHFMQQRIVRLSRYEEKPTRQQVRAAARANKPPPPTPYVDVVKLRSVDYVGRQRGEEEGRRQLTERHVRRAHWRNQHYPSLGPPEQPGTHKPILIAATVVGPEGTPIKGGSKLFSVVR